MRASGDNAAHGGRQRDKHEFESWHRWGDPDWLGGLHQRHELTSCTVTAAANNVTGSVTITSGSAFTINGAINTEYYYICVGN